LRGWLRCGRGIDLEFAGELAAPLPDADLIAAVVGLANRAGGDGPGRLLVGVEPDGRVSGARPRHAGATDPLLVQALIANGTQPALHCPVARVRLEEGEVLVVEVPPARGPVGTAAGTYIRRALGADGKPTSFPYHFHEMQARQAEQARLDYSALPLPEAGWQDLDPLEFERFRRWVRESQGRGEGDLARLADRELARVLGAVEERDGRTVLRVLALLLFGHESALARFLPTHEVAFQVLAGTRVQVNDFFRWPLLRLFDELQARFRARYHEEEVMAGGRRVPVPNLPAKAFREAVANALIHRDYARLGAVHLQWLDERVRVSNPGAFPEGVRLDNVLVTAPKPRNPLLAEALKRVGLVERTSRGIDLIYEEVLRTGRPPPSYAFSSAADVVLEISHTDALPAFTRLVVEEEAAGGGALDLFALLLLQRLRESGRLGAGEAAECTQLPVPTAAEALARLEERGLVVARGEGAQRLWRLPPAVAERLGQPPVLLAAGEPGTEQKEAQILEFVAREGRIRREEAAQLCLVTPRQASYLLDKLVQGGRLERRGERRGTHYAAAAAPGPSHA
jgi:ATP-dependent DNA helicase RecG